MNESDDKMTKISRLDDLIMIMRIKSSLFSVMFVKELLRQFLFFALSCGPDLRDVLERPLEPIQIWTPLQISLIYEMPVKDSSLDNQLRTAGESWLVDSSTASIYHVIILPYFDTH